MNECLAVRGDFAGFLQAFFDALTRQDDVAPIAPGGFLFADGGPFRHDDRGGDAGIAGGKCHPLGVVAGRCGHHAARPDVMHAFQNLVGRSPNLECAGFLKVFQFQKNFAAEHAAHGRRIDERGVKNAFPDSCRGFLKGFRCHPGLILSAVRTYLPASTLGSFDDTDADHPCPMFFRTTALGKFTICDIRLFDKEFCPIRRPTCPDMV